MGLRQTIQKLKMLKILSQTLQKIPELNFLEMLQLEVTLKLTSY